MSEGDHVPFERARVRLSYGQWLRRERRHKDARSHLNAAAHVFRLLAATPWLRQRPMSCGRPECGPALHRRMRCLACSPRNGKSSCSPPKVSLTQKSPRACSFRRERSAPICIGPLSSSAYPIARNSPPSRAPELKKSVELASGRGERPVEDEVGDASQPGSPQVKWSRPGNTLCAAIAEGCWRSARSCAAERPGAGCGRCRRR